MNADTRPQLTEAQRQELLSSAQQLCIEDMVGQVSMFSMLATARCEELGGEDSELWRLMMLVNTVVNEFVRAQDGQTYVYDTEKGTIEDVK